MPFLHLSSAVIEINRQAAILDTNVLLSAFDVGDARHSDSLAYLSIEEQYLVPLAVVIETWGVLVGKGKDWDAGFQFLEWLRNPESGAIVIHECESMSKIHEMATALHMDCVDIAIIYLADRISRECNLSPGCKVATHDRRDFFRSVSFHPFSMTIMDVTTLETTELNSR